MSDRNEEDEWPCGYLGVLYGGRLLQKIKKRWCLLAGQKLYWFKIAQQPPYELTAAKHWLDLSLLRTVVADGSSDSEGHPIFRVSAANTTTCFIAADERQLRFWVAAISRHERRRSSTSSSTMDPASVSGPVMPMPEPVSEAAEDAGRRGYLFMTEERHRHRAKKRFFFELHAAELKCYQESDDVLLEVFPLDSRSTVVASPKEPLTFVVTTATTGLYLGCASLDEHTAWMANMIDAIDELPAEPSSLEKFITALGTLKPVEAEERFQTLGAGYASLATARSHTLLLTTVQHELSFHGPSGRLYERPEAEIHKITAALLSLSGSSYGRVTDENLSPLGTNLKTACEEYPRLRNELYARLVNLTIDPPHCQNLENINHWLVLAVLCTACPPMGAKFLGFMRWYLKRCLQLGPRMGGKIIKIAGYALDELKKNKGRDIKVDAQAIEDILSQAATAGPVKKVNSWVRSIDIFLSSFYFSFSRKPYVSRDKHVKHVAGYTWRANPPHCHSRRSLF